MPAVPTHFPLPSIEASSPLALHLVESLIEARNNFLVCCGNRQYEQAAYQLGILEATAATLYMVDLLPLTELTKIRSRIHTWFDLA